MHRRIIASRNRQCEKPARELASLFLAVGEKSKTSGEPYIPPTTAQAPLTPFFRFRPGLLARVWTAYLKCRLGFRTGSRVPAHPIFPSIGRVVRHLPLVARAPHSISLPYRILHLTPSRMLPPPNSPKMHRCHRASPLIPPHCVASNAGPPSVPLPLAYSRILFSSFSLSFLLSSHVYYPLYVSSARRTTSPTRRTTSPLVARSAFSRIEPMHVFHVHWILDAWRSSKSYTRCKSANYALLFEYIMNY